MTATSPPAAFPNIRGLPGFCKPNGDGASSTCGFGTCTADGTTCVCLPEYSQDLTWILCPNCFMPAGYREIALGVVASLSILVATAGVIVAFRRMDSGVSRRLLLASSLVSAMNALMQVAQIIQQRPGIASWCFLAGFMVVGGMYILPVLLYTIVSPVMIMSMKTVQLRQIEWHLKCANIFSVVVILIFTALLCVYVDDYAKWNTLFQASSVYTATHFSLVCFYIYRWFSALLVHLEGLMTSNAPSQNREMLTRLEIYKHMLSQTVWVIQRSVPLTCFTVYSFALVYWIYGCFPYIFVIYTTMHLVPNVFCIAFIAQRRQQQVNTSHNSENKLLGVAGKFRSPSACKRAELDTAGSVHPGAIHSSARTTLPCELTVDTLPD